MAVLRLRGAPKFTAVALSPASLTGLRRGPQKQRATWSRPRKSRVEGVRSGEARRGQWSPGAGREEPGALRSPLASAGARGAPRARSGPSEPELPPLVSLRDTPAARARHPASGEAAQAAGSAGQGAAARESARAHSRTGLAAEQVTGATCCAASRPWTRQRALTGSRSPKGVRGEPAAHLSPSRLVGFRLNASTRFLCSRFLCVARRK